MDAVPPNIDQRISDVLVALQLPFWHHADFWISLVVGVIGLAFSFAAYVEAKRAKRAANEAARGVKIQTVTIELTEISQRLDRIQPEILFSEARDLLQDISRRIHRALSPFEEDIGLKSKVEAAFSSLAAAQSALKSVRPSDPAREAEGRGTVYYVIEDHFGAISNAVADVLGLLERKTGQFGDDNG